MLRTISTLAASTLLVTGLRRLAQAPATSPAADRRARTAAHRFARWRQGLHRQPRQMAPRVKSPFKVVFGLTGMGVAPAGVQFENAGHHHLLIDTDLPKDLGMPLPADAKHVHFGKGQTETTRDAAARQAHAAAGAG